MHSFRSRIGRHFPGENPGDFTQRPISQIASQFAESPCDKLFSRNARGELKGNGLGFRNHVAFHNQSAKKGQYRVVGPRSLALPEPGHDVVDGAGTILPQHAHDDEFRVAGGGSCLRVLAFHQSGSLATSAAKKRALSGNPRSPNDCEGNARSRRLLTGRPVQATRHSSRAARPDSEGRHPPRWLDFLPRTTASPAFYRSASNCENVDSRSNW